MKWLANPLEIAYKYQHPLHGKYAYREAADPTIVRFGGKYLLFVSKCGGFYFSTDRFTWTFHEDRDLDIHGYAPDVSVRGEWLYFCSSSYARKSRILRSKDPFAGFEEVNAPFAFWDPHLSFEDDKAFLYWGCSSKKPIRVVEMDAERMVPVGRPLDLISAAPDRHGLDDKSPYDAEKRTLWQRYVSLFTGSGTFIEGVYMNRIGNRYYLQYASPGTEYPTYGDGVLRGKGPLGPFVYQEHNPYSLVPGGFCQGAGHGSTFEDEFGNLWHASTICVGVNHGFERRVGLWPAGVDDDGILFCNQYFSDYPRAIPNGKFDPASIRPAAMLLSYRKPCRASSSQEGMGPENAFDESMKTHWRSQSASRGEWLEVDLGEEKEVTAIQVNFGDVETPKKRKNRAEYGGTLTQERYIDQEQPLYDYVVETSLTGDRWERYGGGETPLPHRLFTKTAQARYARIRFSSAPYEQKFAISGFRVFGIGNGRLPLEVRPISARRSSLTRARFAWSESPGATGYCLRLGISPEKMYTSVLLYGQTEYEATFLCAEATSYYWAVDSFNERGITEGKIRKLED